MPKKKVKKYAGKTEDLFSAHPNLAWLLPVMAVITLTFVYLYKNIA